jgi:hypothetical protein
VYGGGGATKPGGNGPTRIERRIRKEGLSLKRATVSPRTFQSIGSANVDGETEGERDGGNMIQPNTMGFAELVSAVEGSQKCAQQQEKSRPAQGDSHRCSRVFTVSYLWRCC